MRSSCNELNKLLQKPLEHIVLEQREILLVTYVLRIEILNRNYLQGYEDFLQEKKKPFTNAH